MKIYSSLRIDRDGVHRVYRTILLAWALIFHFCRRFYFCVYEMNHKRSKWEWLLSSHIIKFNPFSSSFGYVTFWSLLWFHFIISVMVDINVCWASTNRLYRPNDQLAFHLWHTPRKTETSNDLWISAIVVIQSEKMRSNDTRSLRFQKCCLRSVPTLSHIFFNFMWLSNYNVYGGRTVRVRTPTTTKSWYEYIYWIAINWTILLCSGRNRTEKVIHRHAVNAAASKWGLTFSSLSLYFEISFVFKPNFLSGNVFCKRLFIWKFITLTLAKLYYAPFEGQLSAPAKLYIPIVFTCPIASYSKFIWIYARNINKFI